MFRSVLSSAAPRRWELWEYPRRAIVFLICVQLVAASLVGSAVVHAEPITTSDWLFLSVCIVGAVMNYNIERYYGAGKWMHGNGTFSMDDCWILAAAIALPPQLAVVIPLASGAHDLLQRLLFKLGRASEGADGAAARVPSEVHKAMFNAATLTAGASAAAIVYDLAAPAVGHVCAGLLGVAAIMVLTNVPIASVLWFVAAMPFWRTALQQLTGHVTEIATFATLGIVLPLVWNGSSPAAIILLVAIEGVAYRSLLISSALNSTTIDETTGVTLKRYWKMAAQSHLTRAYAGGEPLSLLVVDLDHFKRVNDTYGHVTGDVVLKEVASRLSAAVRPGDLVGRFGGEEFVILLPNTITEEAVLVAERCRAAIAASPLAEGEVDGTTVPVNGSASIGAASSLGRSEELDGILAAADAALYEAKNSGRNRVVAAPLPLVAASAEVEVPAPRPESEQEVVA